METPFPATSVSTAVDMPRSTRRGTRGIACFHLRRVFTAMELSPSSVEHRMGGVRKARVQIPVISIQKEDSLSQASQRGERRLLILVGDYFGHP